MPLTEVVFHGRGGQGAVTAANLLASAALKSGNEGVQAFPLFGAERSDNYLKQKHICISEAR